VIDGESDSKIIADKFAELFQSMTMPNSKIEHERLKHDFEQSFAVYEVNLIHQFDCNVKLVDNCISKLKCGKAAVMMG
jgi:hypothetical protein